MSIRTVALASDHGGIELRKIIAGYLADQGIDFQEFGPEVVESVDYPNLAFTV